MSARKGDWRDLFASHSLAVGAKKLWVAFLGSLATVAVLTVLGAWAMYDAGEPDSFIRSENNFVYQLVRGDTARMWAIVSPLLNPFTGGLRFFCLSSLFYLLALGVWSYAGGAITRLTALEYARDDIPSLGDALEMVRAKRKAYLWAPLTPVFGVILLVACNAVLGLLVHYIAMIPWAGPVVAAVLTPVFGVPIAIITTFMVVLGVLSFGLMFPAISLSGKDAFEGWTTAYSYLLWGFNRFVVYTAMAAVLGVATTFAVCYVSQVFVYTLVGSISVGLRESLVQFGGGGVLQSAGGALVGASWMVILVICVSRILVVAYAFSYFFTANTIICFLLRKHVDRIDVDEIYEEESEEEAQPEQEPAAEPETSDQPEAEAGDQAQESPQEDEGDQQQPEQGQQ